MDSYAHPSDSPSWAESAPFSDRLRERLEQNERAMWLSHPERADPPLPPNALQNVLHAQSQAINSPSTSSLRLDLGTRASPRFDDGLDAPTLYAPPRRGTPSLPDLRRSAHSPSPLLDADASTVSPRPSARSGMPPMPADAAFHVAKAKEQVARTPAETPSRLLMRRYSSDDSSEDEIPSPYERPPTPHSLVRRTRASPLPNGSTLPLEPWEKTRSPPRPRPALRRTVSTVTIVRKTSSRVVPESASPSELPVPPVPLVPSLPGLTTRRTPEPPTPPPPQPDLSDWTSALDTLDAFEPRSLGLWGDPEPDASAGTVLVHDDTSSESAFEAPLKSPPVPQEPNQSQIRLIGGRAATESPRAGSVGSVWVSTPVSSPTQRRIVSGTPNQDMTRASMQTITRGMTTPRTVSTPRASQPSEAQPLRELVTASAAAAQERDGPVTELQRLSLSPTKPPPVPDEPGTSPTEEQASTIETAGPTPLSKDHDLLPMEQARPENRKIHGEAPVKATEALIGAPAAVDDTPAEPMPTASTSVAPTVPALAPAASLEPPAAPRDEAVQPEAKTETDALQSTPEAATEPFPRPPAPSREAPTVPTPSLASLVPCAGIEGPWSVFASPVRLPPVPIPTARAGAPVPPTRVPSVPSTPTRQGASRSTQPTHEAPAPLTVASDVSPTKSGRPNSNPFRRPGSTSSRADVSSHSSELPNLGPDASPAAVAGAAAFLQRRLQEKPTLPTIGPSPDVSGVARTHDDPDASMQTMPGGGPFVPEPPTNEWVSLLLEPQGEESDWDEAPASQTPRAPPSTGVVTTPPAMSSPATARELTALPGQLSPPLTSLATSPVLSMLGSPTQEPSPTRAVHGTPWKQGSLSAARSPAVQSTPPAPSTPSHAPKARAQGQTVSNESPSPALRRGPSMALPGTYVPSVSTSHPPTTPPTASPSTRALGKSKASPGRSTPSNRMATTPPRPAQRAARDYPGLQPQHSLVAPFELQNRSLVLPTGPDVKRPPGGFCLECMMRDEDMIDVKVDDPAVWERESDILFYEAIRWEHKVRDQGGEPSSTLPLRHPTLGTPLTHVPVRQVATGDALSVANLREHTEESRLSTHAKARTVQMFVKQQRRILGLEEVQDTSVRPPGPSVQPPSSPAPPITASPVGSGAPWPPYLSPVLSGSPQPNPYATPPLSTAPRAAAPVTLATIISQSSHATPASPTYGTRSPGPASVPAVPVPGPSSRSPGASPASPRPRDVSDTRSGRKSSESVRRPRPSYSSPERQSAGSPMRSPKRREPGVRRDGTPVSPTTASPRPPRATGLSAPVPAYAPAMDVAGDPEAGLTSELSMDDGPEDARKKQGQPLRGLFRKKPRADDSESVRSRRWAKSSQVSPELSMDDDDSKSFWKRLSRSPKSNSSHKSGRFGSVKMPPPPPVPPVPSTMSPAAQPRP